MAQTMATRKGWLSFLKASSTLKNLPSVSGKPAFSSLRYGAISMFQCRNLVDLALLLADDDRYLRLLHPRDAAPRVGDLLFVGQQRERLAQLLDPLLPCTSL